MVGQWDGVECGAKTLRCPDKPSINTEKAAMLPFMRRM